MKFKLTLLTIGSSLLLLLNGPPFLAQSVTTNALTNTNNISVTGTNTAPLTPNLKYQLELQNERALGERALLPPGLKETMKLTITQRADLKKIEDEFAKTSLEYRVANQTRIDAAQEALRKARTSTDKKEIQIARAQLQGVWVGLHADRERAVIKAKPLLTPEQLKILEDPKNQWREHHADEVNDPSAN